MSTFKDSFKEFKLGPLAALLISVLAMFGGEAIGLLAILGYEVLLAGESLLEALRRIEENIPLQFIVYFLAQIFAIAVIYRYMRRRGGGWKDLGFRRVKVSQLLGVMAVSFLSFLVLAGVLMYLLEALLPQIDLTGEQEIGFLEASRGFELVLAFVALVILAPVAEEIVFRGVLLTAFAKSFGVVGATVLTSLAFALLHPPLSAMITIGIFSLFLSWAYIRTNSLWTAILLHSVKNLIAFIGIFGVGL